MRRNILFIPLFTMLLACLLGCESGFLDKKPQQSLLIPKTFPDFQALLDNSRQLMNIAPYLSLICDGDFRISDAGLQIMPTIDKNSYPWLGITPPSSTDWDVPYKQVFYCNVVLDGLSEMEPSQQQIKTYDQLKGSALFYRAWALFLLSQNFAEPYETETAGLKPGIPLPLTADINNKVSRGTLKETYQQVTADLKTAEALLAATSELLTRPTKPAVYALLARVYLVMGDYTSAEIYADKCLELRSDLIDYNMISVNSAVSFPLPLTKGNAEIIYYTIGNTLFTGSSNTFIDSVLYQSYLKGDLRKSLFFKDNLNYKGSYSGNGNSFMGLATDEQYLIKAECLARKGQMEKAAGVLNALMIKRWEKGKWVDIALPTTDATLEIIISERRKQLVGRGTAWMDLRRLYKDKRFTRTLTRISSGIKYILPPDAARYVFKIPTNEVGRSGIAQNL